MTFYSDLLFIGVIAFVMLKEGVAVEEEVIFSALKDLVKSKIAAFAIPNAFLVCSVARHGPLQVDLVFKNFSVGHKYFRVWPLQVDLVFKNFLWGINIFVLIFRSHKSMKYFFYITSYSPQWNHSIPIH